MLSLGNKIIAGSFKSGASWEVGDVGISAFGIDESLNKRRYLNGQVISQTQFAQFTAFLKSRVSVYPSLATTEVNWQASVTNSDLGQCGQFVIDDDAGTIRLPKVVNIQGLFDLTGLGTTVEAGLPNITGSLAKPTGALPILNGGIEDITKSGALSINTTVKTQTSGTLNIGNYNANTGFSIDASESNSIYGNSSTVQPEAVQYPYFIQVAEGIENSVDVSREIELNNPFSLLDYKYSEYELSNASWLLSNGQYNSGATYPAVYDLLLQIYNGTVTKNGVSVKLSTETYDDTDFVLNTGDTTFRLPVKVKLPNSKGVAGNGMTLGMTNGTQYMGFQENDYAAVQVMQGQYGQSVGNANTTGDNTNGAIGVTTDHTKSGIEVKDDSSIYLYFYVGETVQDANIIAASAALTTISNLTPCHVIVERYINGTSGYDLYDDGMCRQWGIYSGTGTHTAQYTIDLIKSYIDTDYIVTESHTSVDANTTCVYFNTTYAKSVDNFKIQYGAINGGSYAFTFYWETYGKLADGEY